MLKKLFDKQVWAYLIFGVLTTLLNIVSYKVFSVFTPNYFYANALAWVVSVLFAYITNRKYVFNSTVKGFKLFKEAVVFWVARLFSGGVDMFIMYLGVTILSQDDFVVKIVANVIVIVLNYVLGKWVVFLKKSEE